MTNIQNALLLICQFRVKDVMGGKILEYEAKTIRNAGIAVGKAAIKLGLDEETL